MVSESEAAPSELRLPPVGRSRLALLYETVGGAFTLLYLILLSDQLYPPFYALVRGVGTVEYTADITIISRSADSYLFLVALVFLIVLHISRLHANPFADSAGFFPLLGAIAGFGLFLFDGSLASLLLIGVSSIAIIVVGMSRLGGRRALSECAMAMPRACATDPRTVVPSTESPNRGTGDRKIETPVNPRNTMSNSLNLAANPSFVRFS